MLRACRTVADFLGLCGMLEYEELFRANHLETMEDLLNATEADFRRMKVKFGHRKKILELLCMMDVLYSFLQKAELISHYRAMKELGFDNVWCLLGIEEGCREKLGFTEEEMKKVMEARAKLEEAKMGELEKLPELADLSDNTDSKPILCLLFSEEKAEQLMDVGEAGRGEH